MSDVTLRANAGASVKGYLNQILGPITERMGDNKAPVRTEAVSVILVRKLVIFKGNAEGDRGCVVNMTILCKILCAQIIPHTHLEHAF